jgi:2,3-bisphosphoglycerate-independent phosphoglycerate mutase
MNVIDRRAGRIKEGTKELAKMLNGLKIKDVEIIFKESVEHRAVLVLRGKGLSPNVSDVDPHELGPIHESKALSEDAKKTAEILNGFVRLSHELLKNHPVNKERVKKGLPPANIVLPRGAGMVPHLESMEKRHGIKAGAIAGVSIVKGVCRLAGMEIIDVEGAKGTADSDFKAKIKAGLEYLKEGDFVLINMKAPDLFGHDGDPVGKKKILEKIDKAMVPLKDVLDDTIVAITADHSTPCDVMDHSGDPVPLLIAGKGVRTDTIKSFGERNAAKGGICRIKGGDLLNILLQLAGLSEKFGA